MDKFFNQNFEEKKNIKTEDINLLFKSVEPKVKEIFNNYNIDKIFQKYEDKILKYLDEKKDDATVILEKNDKDLKKAFDSISSGLHQIIEDFQNEMDKNIESLVDEIEKLKKEIRETIHKVYELTYKNHSEFLKEFQINESYGLYDLQYHFFLLRLDNYR